MTELFQAYELFFGMIGNSEHGCDGPRGDSLSPRTHP
jgi:hypothetical protein